jgi:ESX secretion-associated protein EspJ
MTESLRVDPLRLKRAGKTLQEIAFPAPPPPIFAAGADPVSAAVNQTSPIIESPVIAGLPAVEAAIKRTGFSIVTAAGLYAETDQALAEHVDSVQFSATAQRSAVRASTPALMSATATQPADGETPSEPAPEPQPDNAVPGFDDINTSLGQLNGVAQALGPVTQTLQSIMSSVQQATGSMGNTGASPAQLADDTEREQSPTEEAQLVDEASKTDDGAAPGDRALEGVPLQPSTSRPTETARSGLEI